MPLTSAQLVRQRIQDIPRYYENATLLGDGTARRFTLPHTNLTTASAYVVANGAWSATGATFNVTGYVDFSGVISANTAFRVTYVHTVFADAVIDEYVSAHGVVGAALQCAYDLQFDGLKRSRWQSPDGASYDDTMARSQLNDIISALKEEQADEATQGGMMWSWSMNQQDY